MGGFFKIGLIEGKHILRCSSQVVMLAMEFFNSPVSVLAGFARVTIIMTSFALQEEQPGQRGPMGLGEIVALCPSASRIYYAAEGVEGSRGDSEAPRPLRTVGTASLHGLLWE